MVTDTIAAISTALSDSGIGMIRISGENALDVGDNIFRTTSGKKILQNVKSHTIHYGYVVDNQYDKKEKAKTEGVREIAVDFAGSIVDEVMVSVMRAPRSFTAEDTVEISCHGGVLVMKKILDLACRNGARLAEPGEFTKRAFLNGRIDLSRAEAVMDVIYSQNELALKSSLNQLQGRLSDQIKELRNDLIYEIAFIESALDDPEHISLEGYPQKLYDKIKVIRQKISHLITTSDNGILMKEGISTVILGKPNVGKSSLMNLLLGEDRAIVTDIAGTTRDALKESINLQGITLNIIDTAGIHFTEDVVEKIGVEKAKKYAEDADLILCVVDSSVNLDDSDREIFSLMRSKKSIVILNKTDLDQRVNEKNVRDFIKLNMDNFECKDTIDCSSENIFTNMVFVQTSAKDSIGLDMLEEEVKKMFFSGMIQSSNEVVITNVRHKNALVSANDSLGLVLKSIEDDMPEDFYSIDLMSAYSSLGLIIGEEVEDDLMEEIFSKFCMGK